MNTKLPFEMDAGMKLFTVEEANALLPTVRKILARIQRTHKRIFAYRQDAKKAAEGAEQGGGGLLEGLQYAKLLMDLTSKTGELEALGVQLKDFDRGLVDFPSLRDGRVVLLCWQIGEGDELEWWHDVEAGFAGRTPL
ncbi:MAG TPA: DUF2203 domain-containing protein [Pyrinomonadaceae bacterium]|nr:DUF2203 domain-containing protein [Pyrinomonadaceae bacterium]